MLNSLFWDSNRGSIVFGSDQTRQFGIMQIGSGSSSFPYYKSLNFSNLKPDYNSISFIVKFSSNPINQGAGYILSDNVPQPMNSLNFSNYLFYIWPKPNGTFHLFSTLCPFNYTSCNINLQLSNGVYPMPIDGNWHNISIKKINSHYELFVDDVLIFKTVDTSRTITSIGIGDPEITTSGLLWPKLYIDLIGLDYKVLPTFPYLSQKDERWGSEEYDSAIQWAGLGKDGIDRWGCALTSTVMMLQNYGVKSLDGTELNPSKLNNWLKSQPDGYIGAGLLNWIAVTRYVKESYLSGNSPKKLEYVRSYLPETPLLPAILGTPGHFVLAHTEDLLSWNINDPIDLTKTTLAKTSTIKSINRFVPSLTDLSYMLFVSKNKNDLIIKDSNGNNLLTDWTDEYLSDDIGVSTENHTFVSMIPKPTTGDYTIRTNNLVEMYLYDEVGNVKELSLNNNTYLLQYDKVNIQNSKVDIEDITKPIFVSSTTFSGWYKSPQQAIFQYDDENLRPDYTNPTCTILNEGFELTCSIIPNVCDKFLNCNSDIQISNKVNIDWSAPTSIFTLPTISNNWSGEISGHASDEVSGVSKVELIIHDPLGTIATVVANGSTLWKYVIPILHDGKYSISSRATDFAGNTEASTSQKQIILDTQAPSSPSIKFVSGWWNKIWISWKDASDISKYQIFYGTKRDALTKIAEVTNTSWTSDELKQGQYYIALRAVDFAGNISALSNIYKVEVHKKWDFRHWFLVKN